MNDTNFILHGVVFITADHPSGSSERTYGDVGVIDDLFVDQDGTKSYKVKTDVYCGYWYDENEIRGATFEEVKHKLCEVLGIK